MSVKAMGSHLSVAILMLCLWAGLAILMWDADTVFVSVVASFLATCILGLPVGFAAGLLWRTGEVAWDAVTWVRERRRYRRLP